SRFFLIVSVPPPDLHSFPPRRSSDLLNDALGLSRAALELRMREHSARTVALAEGLSGAPPAEMQARLDAERRASQAIEIALFGADRKSTRLNSSHEWISYAVFCLKKK